MTDKALLVGINAYPNCPLNGCVNDITDMANYLSSSCGMSAANIRLLVDDRATTQAILERLEWLVNGASPGDRLFFHYSGHGVQVPTRNAAGEVDSLDEAICPVDFDWSDARMIRDKDFYRIFSKIPEGVDFIWVSDSCHSGDLSREFTQTKVKTIPMPVDINWRAKTAKEIGIVPQGMGKDITGTATLNVALISGCKSNQTSADAFINGRYNGACTYYLLKELSKTPDAPLNKIIENVDAAIKQDHYEQIPGLEGSQSLMNKSFFTKR